MSVYSKSYEPHKKCGSPSRTHYIIRHHDGIKEHRDGSRFDDLAVFSNKKEAIEYENLLEWYGYQKRNPLKINNNPLLR